MQYTAKTAPMAELAKMVNGQWAKGNKHFLPPYRFDTKIQIMDLLGMHPSQQKEKASLALIQAVVKMRSSKEPQEIEAIERACDVGYAMHTTAQLLIRSGVTERFIGGQVDGRRLYLKRNTWGRLPYRWNTKVLF